MYFFYSHENAGGFYRVSVYFISKYTCDIIPLRVIPLIVYSLIAYFMIGEVKCLCMFAMAIDFLFHRVSN